jgi:hypothetical protein
LKIFKKQPKTFASLLRTGSAGNHVSIYNGAAYDEGWKIYGIIKEKRVLYSNNIILQFYLFSLK